jgi:RNA polymerase sigma-70 factor (ECF subfamily)
MPTAATFAAPCTTPAAPLAQPGWAELAAHRGALVRFAQRKLLDPCLAEDVVHDVFEAVLSGRAQFAGRSALRSWLTAILKHKIVDLVRERAPYESLDAGWADDDVAEAPLTSLTCPQPGPDEVAEQRQRLARTLARIDAMPEALREVLTRRVFFDEPTPSVCAALAISEENLFVRLHRARKHLLS